MNFYSVLGDSDDEETPKVVTKTAANKENKDTKKPAQNTKPAAASNTAPNKANDSKGATKGKLNFNIYILLLLLLYCYGNIKNLFLI